LSHYETLGVPPDASAGDIKRAFKRKAAEHHPDRGGDPAKMVAINRAYEVLGDPARRQAYDTNGSEVPLAPIEEEGRHVLTQLFGMAIEEAGDDEILHFVRQGLKSMVAQGQQEIAGAERKRERLKAKRYKVKVRMGENIVHQLIDSQSLALSRRAAMARRAIDAARAAEVLLENYSAEAPQPNITGTITWTASPFYSQGGMTNA
jgi:curved DNA-binding protein CbpA